MIGQVNSTQAGVTPFVSQAMGVNKHQVNDFKKLHPDIPITKTGDIGPFTSYHEHKTVMKKLGFYDRGE